MEFKGWSGDQMHLALARLTEKTKTGFHYTARIPLGEQVEVWSTRLVPDAASKRKKADDLYPAGVLVRSTFSGKGTGRRRAYAACYHAHGHFMRALFDMNPNGRIVTEVARYNGMEGFNENAPVVGYMNRGSSAQPEQYRELCDCYEHGCERF